MSDNDWSLNESTSILENQITRIARGAIDGWLTKNPRRNFTFVIHGEPGKGLWQEVLISWQQSSFSALLVVCLRTDFSPEVRKTIYKELSYHYRAKNWTVAVSDDGKECSLSRPDYSWD